MHVVDDDYGVGAVWALEAVPCDVVSQYVDGCACADDDATYKLEDGPKQLRGPAARRLERYGQVGRYVDAIIYHSLISWRGL